MEFIIEGDVLKKVVDCEASVEVPEGVREIAYGAFKSQTALEEIFIPASVQIIKDSVFLGCKNLARVTGMQGVTKIGGSAFFGCPFEAIELPETLAETGDGTFRGCPNLKEVVIPESLTTYGWQTFRDCPSLTKVTIPGTMTRVDDSMFEGCTSLTEVVMGEGVREIGYRAFADTNLADLELPATVAFIDKEAFRNAFHGSTCLLPWGMRTISLAAFCLCEMTLYVPETCKKIDEGIFDLGKHCTLCVPAKSWAHFYGETKETGAETLGIITLKPGEEGWPTSWPEDPSTWVAPEFKASNIELTADMPYDMSPGVKEGFAGMPAWLQ